MSDNKPAKEKREKSFLNASQLLEIKHVLLTTLTEIKDLRGDQEFLLRKANTLTELSKVWLELVKTEEARSDDY